MKKKIAKIAALFASFVLVIVATVGVTLAYLTKTTGAVTNTFVARSGLLASPEVFTLLESEVGLSTDGNSYVKKGEGTTNTNEYEDLLAGMTLYKDPTVNLGKLVASAYLFVEIKENNMPTKVVEEQTVSILTYTVNDNWTKLGIKGANNGDLYVYIYNDEATDQNIIPVTGEGVAVGEVDILENLGDEDNVYHVSVGNFDAGLDFQQEASLVFNAYLCQTAGFANATAAYEACF